MITLIISLVSLDPHPLLEVCQGEDAVVVCRTNDGGLFWMVVGESNTRFGGSTQINTTEQRGIFTVRLDSKNASIFVSTAVARNVQLINNRSSIACSDNNLDNSLKVTLIVLGMMVFVCVCVCVCVYVCVCVCCYECVMYTLLWPIYKYI